MEISKLYEMITFQRNCVEADKIGNRKNVWRDHFTCHAYPSTYSPAEKDAAGTTQEKRAVIFTVRYCRKLDALSSTGFRILFRGEIYNILSVDMMNYDHKSIKLECEKERDRR